MGKSAPTPPPAPDPVAIAKAQGDSNIETARLTANLNRVDQNTPYGNITYTNTGNAWLAPQLEQAKQAYLTGGGTEAGWGTAVASEGGRGGGWGGGRSGGAMLSPMEQARKRLEGQNPDRDKWSSTTTFSPNQQRISDLTEQSKIQYGEIGNESLGRVRDIMGTSLDFSGLPQVGDSVTNRQRVEDALFGRMQPQLDAQRTGLDTRLRNQGLTPGSEAWQRAWQEYSTSENDARLGVIGAAGQEQQRLFGMATADRERELREMLAQRQIPLNESAALLGGAQVSYPQFSNVPGAAVQPTDVVGANQLASNAANANYNAQMQGYAGMNSGIASLLGAGVQGAFMLSDERAKENIQKVGELDNGLDVHLFNYKGGSARQMGVMAQDVEKMNPSAVRTRQDGLKEVNLEQAVLASRSRKGTPRHV